MQTIDRGPRTLHVLGQLRRNPPSVDGVPLDTLLGQVFGEEARELGECHVAITQEVPPEPAAWLDRFRAHDHS